MNIDLGDLNWLAVAVVAIASFALGGGWYAALGKPWMALSGMSEEKIKAASMSQGMVGYSAAALNSIVATIALGVLLQATGAADALDGLIIGLLIGVAVVAVSQLPNYLFEHKPVGLWLINLGYPVVHMALGGLVLGVWE